MGEAVNVVVALTVMVFLFRWLTSGDDSQRGATEALGFRPRNVTQEMVDTISAMFPDIPKDNIRYDLLRTGSVEITTNKLLERGFLPAPPAVYFTIYPSTTSSPSSTQPQPAVQPQKKEEQAKQDLLSRYNLQSRTSDVIKEEEVGGKAVWEDTPEKREASLRERKAKMVLAARQRLLAQQKEKDKES